MNGIIINNALTDLGKLFYFCGRNFIELEKSIFEIEALPEALADSFSNNPITDEELNVLLQKVTINFLNYLETAHSFGDRVMEIAKTWDGTKEFQKLEYFEKTKKRDDFSDVLMVAEKLRNLLHHNCNTNKIIYYAGVVRSGVKGIGAVNLGSVYIDQKEILDHPNYLEKCKNVDKKTLHTRTQNFFNQMPKNEKREAFFLRGKLHLEKNPGCHTHKGVRLHSFVDNHFDTLRSFWEEINITIKDELKKNR